MSAPWIGIRPGRYDLIRYHITRIGADASHVLGRASARGRTVRDRQQGPRVIVVVHVRDPTVREISGPVR